MLTIELLLATERFQRIDRDGRVQADVLSRLRRWGMAATARACCTPPCCVCCWEAV